MDISDETMLRLLQSAMYGEAIGDALGVPYEGRTEERERDAAHERAVAVVALAIQTVVGVQGLVCGAPHTERCAVAPARFPTTPQWRWPRWIP